MQIVIQGEKNNQGKGGELVLTTQSVGSTHFTHSPPCLLLFWVSSSRVDTSSCSTLTERAQEAVRACMLSPFWDLIKLHILHLLRAWCGPPQSLLCLIFYTVGGVFFFSFFFFCSFLYFVRTAPSESPQRHTPHTLKSLLFLNPLTFWFFSLSFYALVHDTEIFFLKYSPPTARTLLSQKKKKKTWVDNNRDFFLTKVKLGSTGSSIPKKMLLCAGFWRISLWNRKWTESVRKTNSPNRRPPRLKQRSICFLICFFRWHPSVCGCTAAGAVFTQQPSAQHSERHIFRPTTKIKHTHGIITVVLKWLIGTEVDSYSTFSFFLKVCCFWEEIVIKGERSSLTWFKTKLTNRPWRTTTFLPSFWL